VNGRAERREAIHVGVAISLRGGGLVAPALLDADQQPLEALMRALKDLVQRARAGSLRSTEMTEPTVTVTNLGERGVATVYGVIYPPQLALVGFGAIVERPWVVDGRSARPIVNATLRPTTAPPTPIRGAIFLDALGAWRTRQVMTTMTSARVAGARRIAPELDPAELAPGKTSATNSTWTRWISSIFVIAAPGSASVPEALS
jgi:hypothetical protein